MSKCKWWDKMWKSKNQKELEKQVQSLEKEIKVDEQTIYDLEIEIATLGKEIKSLQQVIHGLEQEQGSCEKENSECIVFIRGIQVEISDFLKNQK